MGVSGNNHGRGSAKLVTEISPPILPRRLQDPAPKNPEKEVEIRMKSGISPKTTLYYEIAQDKTLNY
ncbi:CIC11C00000001456 [Sungouiella intermedia]|uniref:CIC11C00000001456 n=1 Tax=Sungouiella intermedia TaxID=45354 RepID=A0A1L0BY49_9ASCO|nr:CIC11C00000001456 [[Candida] intermedia]